MINVTKKTSSNHIC